MVERSMIAETIADLQKEEGWRSVPYKDTEGLWTVGWGFLVDPSKPWMLPREVGDVWLKYIVERTYEDLLGRLPWLIDQDEDVQRALLQMAYQMGVDGLLGFKDMLASLQWGDRDEAADEALDSKWARQTPARANRVAHLLRGDDI